VGCSLKVSVICQNFVMRGEIYGLYLNLKLKLIFWVRASKLTILTLRMSTNLNFKKFTDARFEFLKAALLKNRVLRRVTLFFFWASICRRFEGSYCPPVQGSNNSFTVPIFRRHYCIQNRRETALTYQHTFKAAIPHTDLTWMNIQPSNTQRHRKKISKL